MKEQKTKTNSPQLNEEFDKFIHLKETVSNLVGGDPRFNEIESEILAIKEKYNLTPTGLSDIVTCSLTEDELLHTLKKY
jgi:replication initiation and membrane attachment protein DnaB